MIVLEEPEMELKLNPCASCGKPKVLKPGDYCTSCALDPALPASEHEYVIISSAMLDIAVKKSGLARKFLVAKMDQAFKNFQHYVIFKAQGEWHDITISDRFHIPTVMKYLFDRLED